MMNKLSVVIITFNEEENIGRCLDSVHNVADEIVIVDSFSKDSTKKICIERGVRFIEHAFEGHIQQKNYAASLATYDYVISLDADEALCPLLQKSILAEKSNFSKDGYTMNRMTNYLGKWIRHGSWYPDKKLRLWNRQKGSWGGQNPHDCYQMESTCTIGYLKGDILHYSYTSIEGHIAQFDKFTSISAKHMYDEGKKAGLLQIFINPLANFIKGFFIRLAFLDGYYGMVICIINAFATFMKYVKLRELNKNR
jgi:glycosyltransferase involved in cell wall biosynthesis